MDPPLPEASVPPGRPLSPDVDREQRRQHRRMPHVHLKQALSAQGGPGSPPPRRRKSAALKRAVILAATAFLAASPMIVNAAGGTVPPLPSLPETPQTDDPTVIVLSIEH